MDSMKHSRQTSRDRLSCYIAIHLTLCYSDLANLEVEHPVRRAAVPVSHFVRYGYTCHWNTVFNLTSGQVAPLWQRVREGEVLG